MIVYICVGVTSPLGYFDPLGLAKDKETFDQYRASELKHGRVAQLAVLGYIIPEIYKVFIQISHTLLAILMLISIVVPR